MVVDGWQQGWIVPAGVAGTVTLTFDLDTPYRWSLAVGLALMVVLFVVALGRGPATTASTTPRAVAASPPMVPAIAFLAASFLIAGWPGVLIAGIAGALAWRVPPRLRPLMVFGSLLVSSVVLATGPWHSGAPYAGYSGWAQALALAAIAMAVTPAARPPRSKPT